MEFVIIRVFALLACVQLSLGQVALMPIPSTVPGLSDTCIAVIGQEVNCNSSLAWAGINGRFESDDTLNGLCTSACSTGLATWARRINGACGTERFETEFGYAWLPQVFSEMFTERFNSLCLKNSAGKFCNAVLRDLAGIDPDNQAVTASVSSQYACNDCLLSLFQTELEMPLTSNSLMSSAFAAMTKSCSIKNYTFAAATATTTWSILANATSWATTLFPTTSAPTTIPTGCSGSTYTIKSGDTCQSISISQGISTVALLTANNLQSKCLNFPQSGTLCIPASGKCQVHTVAANETCTSLADMYSVTWAQIVSWNAIVGVGCTKISSYVGYQLCVSNPGGTYVNPYPSSTTATTSTSLQWPFNTLAITHTSPSGPLQTLTGTVNDNTTIPFANGTRQDCMYYATGYVNSTTIANVTTEYPVTCADIAAGYGVTLSDLLDWNPSLVGMSPCSLSLDEQYCVQYVSLVSENTTPYCARRYLTGPGDTCNDTLASYGLTVDQFYAWNSDVGPSCEDWKNGYQYCVEVQHFRQPGIVSTCNLFAMNNVTDWTLDPCQLLETQFGLSHARFVAWNPAVTTNCTDIYYHYDYCVSIPNYRPTYTTPSSTMAATLTTAPTAKMKLA